MKNLFRIVSCVIAGFFVYMVGIIAFVDAQPREMKFVIMGVFSIPVPLFLLVALARVRFENWKRDVGIVFVSGTAFTLMVVITFACMMGTPEFASQFDAEKLAFFGDYVWGFGYMATIGVIGASLLWHSKSNNSSKESDKNAPPPLPEN